MQLGPERLCLGRGELIVGQGTRGVKLSEMFDLVRWVRRGRRILRLVLLVISWSPFGLLGCTHAVLVVGYRPSRYCTHNECSASYASPESHGGLLSVRFADHEGSGHKES
jgi:hypothetical protein